MKIVVLSVSMILAYIGIVLSPAWALIEFILYLVKDRPFNWWSVWTVFICIAWLIFCIIAVSVSSAIEDRKERKTYKSKFQERLELMAKQRGQTK